ncbi:MAG TPA: 5-formyltetrahydrofolate cyclo-ligase [Acidimicrobiales bacterium]|nr:5-formyltetrahydrofolate cyclo-ligase [Acidimicrobiales bacterium]
MTDRRELRAALLDKRSRLTPADVARTSASVARRVIALPELERAARIAAYRAVRGEVNCDPIVQWAWHSGRRVYIPVTQRPRTMTFARWRDGDRFCINRFGIDEPLPTARRVALHRLDVVLVPLVAFDRHGTRLGHGAGYYDAAFAFRRLPRRTRPVLVGLAHAFQEVDHLDAQEWDVPLDFVVTEQRTIRAQP